MLMLVWIPSLLAMVAVGAVLCGRWGTIIRVQVDSFIVLLLGI